VPVKPVKVTFGESAFWQTVASPEILAVGRIFTVTEVVSGTEAQFPEAGIV
jgi:hypothetical protein